MTNGGQQPEQSTSAGAMCKIRPAMGIETSGKYAWRTDLSDGVDQLLDENALQHG